MTSTIETSEPSPGVRVVTLSRPEAANALIQVPNSLFFQKSVRRWR